MNDKTTAEPKVGSRLAGCVVWLDLDEGEEIKAGDRFLSERGVWQRVEKENISNPPLPYDSKFMVAIQRIQRKQHNGQ